MSIPIPGPLAAFVAFIFGAIVGSFLNVCIVRIPKGESLISPPSHCPDCKAPIPFYDNIPLLSYTFLRGRCRSCKERISARYFFVELLTALLALALFDRLGLSFGFLALFVFVAALIVISFIDLAERIVPDRISLPGIGVGLLASIVNSQLSIGQSAVLPLPLSSLVGILIGGGSLLLVAWAYQLFSGAEGMGGGDIKLLAMIGAFLGWPSVLVTLFVGSMTGSVAGVFLMIRTGAGGKYALPFAPFLCLGAVFHIFFGDVFISFYIPSE